MSLIPAAFPDSMRCAAIVSRGAVVAAGRGMGSAPGLTGVHLLSRLEGQGRRMSLGCRCVLPLVPTYTRVPAGWARGTLLHLYVLLERQCWGRVMLVPPLACSSSRPKVRPPPLFWPGANFWASTKTFRRFQRKSKGKPKENLSSFSKFVPT